MRAHVVFVFLRLVSLGTPRIYLGFATLRFAFCPKLKPILQPERQGGGPGFNPDTTISLPQSTDLGGKTAPFFSLPGVKFVIIGFISIILLIPTIMIWGLIDERSERSDMVARKISAGWGGEQIINGPYLAIPVDRLKPVSGQSSRRWALVMPEKLDVNADLKVEERSLSIYSLPVYGSRLSFSGVFGGDALQAIAREGESQPDFSRAMLVMGINDMTGIRSDAAISINGGVAQPFEAGLNGLTAFNSAGSDQIDEPNASSNDSGVHTLLASDLATNGFRFSIDLVLNGSGLFAMAPAGQSSRLQMKADWPHPGFEGKFLPETKTIGDTGFEATWTVPSLARGVSHMVIGDRLPLQGNLMVIKLVEPVKFYQTISRTLKYSIGFISLAFLAVFVMELKGGAAIHSFQYVLTGLALVVFYVLLLALSEHVGFGIAYLVSATATISLIGTYVGMVTHSRRAGLSLAAVIGVAYAILYLIMREDDYALLAGAIMAFLTIAATMFTTRNVDWDGSRRAA